MTNPLQDALWLHLGRQLPPNALQLARQAGGAVLQAPLSKSTLQQLRSWTVPWILQHDGRIDAASLSLLDPEQEWLFSQDGASAVTSRAQFLDGSPEDVRSTLRHALATTDGFVTTARSIGVAKTFLPLFALDRRWLTQPALCKELTNALRTLDSPVAIMLGKRDDPLDSARAVEGLVTLIENLSQLVLLRCDHGALGAYAFGALGGSIGVTPTARHFVPPGQGGFADVDDPTPRVFVRPLLDWWRGSRLESYAEDPLFNSCSCAICNGRSLARFADERLREEADAHSVACWSEIASRLRNQSETERVDFWIKLCQEAYSFLDEIEDRYDGLPHPPSKQLKAWLRFSGVRAV